MDGEGTPTTSDREGGAAWTWRHGVTALGLVAVLAGAGLLGWWVARVTAARPQADLVEATAPLTPAEQEELLASFRLPTFGGAEVGPPDHRGQVVVLDFWATWCGPCRAQTRILSGLFEEYAEKGVVFLGVNVAEPDELVETFLADEPADWPTLLDRDGAVSTRLEVFGLPTVMVLDAEGGLVSRNPGLTGSRSLRAVIDEALGLAEADSRASR